MRSRGFGVDTACFDRPRLWLAPVAWMTWFCIGMAQAQTDTPPRLDSQATIRTLAQAVEAAWLRQPEQRALQLRRDAAQAQRRVAQALTPEPLAVEASTVTDRIARNKGAREYEIGVAVPLWLPGERSRAEALAEAEAGIVDARSAAARLRLAGLVREAWWALQFSQQDLLAARARLAGAQALAGDVSRRLRAGDLARADQNQAQSAIAAAQSDVAAQTAAVAQATQTLRALVGPGPAFEPLGAGEPEPGGRAVTDRAAPAPQPDGSDHPALAELAAKALTARRSLALASTQRHGNPEFTVLTTRDRGATGEPYGQTVTFALRFPLGSADRYRTKTASAGADLAEAEAALEIERDRIAAESQGARERLVAARAVLEASTQRARLASETRGFFDKSFRAGETDLPTRLRVELEAVEAERQLARARIEVWHAVSSLRQALGLLPD